LFTRHEAKVEQATIAEARLNNISVTSHRNSSCATWTQIWAPGTYL